MTPVIFRIDTKRMFILSLAILISGLSIHLLHAMLLAGSQRDEGTKEVFVVDVGIEAAHINNRK